MIHRHLALAISAACLALAIGCGTNEPPNPGSDDYFPLAVGDYWKYKETGYDDDQQEASRIIGHEVVDYIDMDFEHDAEGALPVFVVEDSFPAPGEPGADDPRLEYVFDDGNRAVRKHQETYDRNNASTMIKMRDYEPGLLRFDRGRTVVGDDWSENPTMYTVSFPEEPDDGVWDNEYLFTVLEPATVTVPAGKFDCIVVQRECVAGLGCPTTAEPETKVYYYALGVGKVKEVTTPSVGAKKTEELVEYHIEPAADDGV